MFETIMNFFKKLTKQEQKQSNKDTAKERLHLVLMQDRANVSADFLDLMKQEIIEVIKKYIDVDENSIDVRLTNKTNSDGTTGAPALYANIPIVNIKEETRKMDNKMQEEKKEEKKEPEKVEEQKDIEEAKKIIEKENQKEEKQEEKKEDKEEQSKEEKQEEVVVKEEKQEEQQATQAEVVEEVVQTEEPKEEEKKEEVKK